MQPAIIKITGGQLQQAAGECIQIDKRTAAVTGKQVGGFKLEHLCLYLFCCQWQRSNLHIRPQLDIDSATTNHQHRTKQIIVPDADDQFVTDLVRFLKQNTVNVYVQTGS